MVLTTIDNGNMVLFYCYDTDETATMTALLLLLAHYYYFDGTLLIPYISEGLSVKYDALSVRKLNNY